MLSTTIFMLVDHWMKTQCLTRSYSNPLVWMLPPLNSEFTYIHMHGDLYVVQCASCKLEFGLTLNSQFTQNHAFIDMTWLL